MERDDSAHWAEQRRHALSPPAGEAVYLLRVSADGLCVARWHEGRVCESYAFVPRDKAALYAAAISQGFQPPRDLRPFE